MSKAIFRGAGGENRTPVTSLENWDNSRYTTPAYGKAVAGKPAFTLTEVIIAQLLRGALK